ncbi:MAG: hypothetical protein FWH11_00685 [Micrococcales bacterium]|nr:hypothetical protein [Micrococcales bacterium]
MFETIADKFKVLFCTSPKCDKPEEPETEAEAILGAYFYSLLAHSDWVERRIVSVEPIDGERSLRKVSIDINVDKVRRFADDAGLSSQGGLLVPLGLLRKEIILDFSVTDQDGRPTSVLFSEKNSEVWKEVLLYIVRTAPEYRRFRGQHQASLDEICDLLGNDIYEVVTPITACDRLGASPAMLELSSTFALRAAIKRYLEDKEDPATARRWARLSITRDAVWDELFGAPISQQRGKISFVELLKCAILCFIPIIEIYPAPAAKQIVIKYEFQMVSSVMPVRWSFSKYSAKVHESIAEKEHAEGRRMSSLRRVRRSATGGMRWILKFLVICVNWLAEFLGFFGYRVKIDTAMVSHASREHLKVVCPDGVYAWRLKYKPSPNNPAALALVLPQESGAASQIPESIMKRVTRDRAILYNRSRYVVFDPAQRCRVTARLRPRLTGFSMAALVTLTIATTLSWLCKERPDLLAGSDQLGSVNAFSTVLLLSSSLFSFYAARPDEHRYRGLMLTFPRTVVALSGAAPAVIAITAMYHSVGPGASDCAIEEAEKHITNVAEWAFLGCRIIFAYLLAFIVVGLFARGLTLLHKENNVDLLK